MKIWLEQSECTGCEACSNACKTNALIMKQNSCDGFFYPAIDENKCIDCGACMQVCPVISNKALYIFNDRGKYSATIFQAQSLDDNLRFSSTSGGIFSEIANAFLEREAIVYGAVYGKNMEVYHMGIDSASNISKLRQSKYVQSRIYKCYLETLDYLKNGFKVLFVGSPCQIAALYAFLGKDYDNLYTIEFICLGVNSPLAYYEWIKELEHKNKSKIISIWFKYKSDGWKKSPFCTRIDFENGKKIILNKNNNYYMKGYLQGNIFLRNSCTQCRFMGTTRVADITLGDYWGIKNNENDDKGTSIVIVNSSKGLELFGKIKNNIKFKKVMISDVLNGNPRITTPVPKYQKTEEFYNDIKSIGFEKGVKKHINESGIKSVVKKLINRITKTDI